MTSDRLILTSLAVALSLGLAGACYDLTPVPPTGDNGGGSCIADMTTPDACTPAEVPDAGDDDADIDGGVEAADNGDLDSSVDGESTEEASP